MKKMFRCNRLSKSVLILMMVALLFTGCDADTSSNASSAQTDTAASVEEIAAVEYDASTDVDETDDDEENLSNDGEETAAQVAETEMSAAETEASSSETETSSDGSTITSTTTTSGAFDLSSIAAYSGSAYAVVNGNVPYFTADEITTTSYESYSSLDSLGRCGVAMACIGTDIMPTESRGNIGNVKPTGWHTIKYDCVSGSYLYNRCHLIAYELAGENANEKNLITGTRYMNVTGMLPFENMVTDFVKETGYHVMYRVTPIFEGTNLIASGVLMEGYSVEDSGAGIEFCVYCYNVQPGIVIDYATGDSYEESTGSAGVSGSSSSSSGSSSSSSSTSSTSASTTTTTDSTSSSSSTYILNTNTKKFHYSDCSSVKKMSESNKKEYSGSRDDIIAQGYSPCGNCNP